MGTHTDNLKQQLSATEARIRGKDGSYSTIAARQADDLRRRIADSERLDRLEAQAAKDREQRQREADREARARLESELMGRYRQMVPGASAHDARVMLPKLLEQWREKQVVEADAEHRATVSRYRSEF